MRPTLSVLKTGYKPLLAREWKPRPMEEHKTIMATARRPERFHSQIILTDGSSFHVRSTMPRPQVKISKDTRSHPLWNPQGHRFLDADTGFLSSFRKKFRGYDTTQTNSK